MTNEAWNTKAWVESHGIAPGETAPAVEDYDEPYNRSAGEIAARALVLQGVIAVVAEVNPAPILDWFKEQNIWHAVTPQERHFLLSADATDEAWGRLGWHMEAQWALLWAIGMVESLGLPTRTCDSARIVDEIMPALGDDISAFVASARLRTPGELLAEDDRTYNMWCYAQVARREGTLPSDLNWSVLYERRYAFEWLQGPEEWDDVTCDA